MEKLVSIRSVVKSSSLCGSTPALAATACLRQKLELRQVFSYKKSDTANKISRHILKRIYVITLKLVGKILEDL